MRPDNRKRGGINWSSLIGWIIFILVIAGGPLFNLLNRVLGSAGALPANLSSLLPILIAGLVVLSIVVSAVRALGGRNRMGGPRLPTDLSPPARPSSAPMPPFGNQRGPLRPPSMPAPRAFTQPSSSTAQQRLPAARFDPVINPVLLAVGILGLLVLGGAALFFLAQGSP
jgi:hypothetical protein